MGDGAYAAKASLLLTHFSILKARNWVCLAARYAVPTIGSLRSFTEAGGLISFNSNVRDIQRQVAIYTGRILKGEKPADLPVVLPTKYDLVINSRAAHALGLTIPLPLLGRADEMIE
jgi:putative tryptophan/tyrosine transport system substrate-binding protein